MAKPKRIYLAGPEVFFPPSEHQTIVAEKKRLLREYGFEGVAPLDTELVFSDNEAKPECGLQICQANRELMDSCDAIIANPMIEGGICDYGGQLFVAEQPGEHRFFSAELFRRCVRVLAHD